ncbi:hypothetical protein FZC83_09020 [Rossellomorea marisflavi]|uniref:Uncharacterized protein n=1 Tax=Rossellomorea marisflavi TaxID=189381 RepID=A0A5D4RYZ4_9BACI|nr:hypothetical protein FZC83_09020 [Rossellomorea marisflavi]
MNCECVNGTPATIRIEGDVGADPIWCHSCGSNLEFEELALSDLLSKELAEWGKSYGEWIDWDSDKLRSGGIEMEEVFNQKGSELASRVKKELVGRFDSIYLPSTSARFYASIEKRRW